MSDSFVFDFSEFGRNQPTVFHGVAALLCSAYIFFALIVVGIPQLSRGGVVVTVAAFVWALLGVLAGKFIIPKILLGPSLFYLVILVSGFLLPAYPVDYIGQMTTVWLGSITIAFFVANGVSLKLIVLGFVAVFLANLIAIGIGYDGYQINVAGHSASSLESEEIKRVSGLAGQPNLLVALTFTLPFLVFLLRERLGTVLYIVGVVACISIMILTASRSTVPFTFLFIVAGALFLIKHLVVRATFVVLGLAGLVFFYSFLQDPLFLSKVENSPLGQLHITERVLNGLDGLDDSAEVRGELATKFWDEFNQRPLMGFGPDQFKEVSGDGLYAHNNLAEIAVNFGTLGLLVYYSMYAIALFGIIKFLPRNYFMLATLGFLLLADISFVTYTERPMVLCLSLLLVTAFNIKGGRRRRRRRRMQLAGR